MRPYNSKELECVSLETSKKYLSEAHKNIIEIYGVEYAKQHPELIIALMNTTAYTFRTGMLMQGIQAIDDSLENISNRLSWLQKNKK